MNKIITLIISVILILAQSVSTPAVEWRRSTEGFSRYIQWVAT
jgi:hypothetical protein